MSTSCYSKAIDDPVVPTKIYADLDAVQNAVVSSSLEGPDFTSAASAEVVVPVEDVAAASAAAAAAFGFQWEYLDANTVIPIHIGTDSYQTLEGLSLPHGFIPNQQFPYSQVAPPPPPPSASSSSQDNHSILIQRVAHRSRKGRGKLLKWLGKRFFFRLWTLAHRGFRIQSKILSEKLRRDEKSEVYNQTFKA